MNLKLNTLLTACFLSISGITFGQSDLSLCVTMPNGKIITGIESIGDLNGDCYETEIQTSNLEFCPTKDNSLLNGVDVLDAVYLQHYILSGAPITPYELIAIDLNNSGTYDEIEMVFLLQLILGTLTDFPNNASWKFAPESIIPSDPTDLILPDCFEFTNLPQSDTSVSVIGFKIGDMNYSAQPGDIIDTTESIPNPLVFKTIDQDIYAGDTIVIHFKSENFNQIAGYQNTIKFDPNVLEVLAHEDFGIYSFATFFGDIDNENGILNTLGRTWSGLYGFADATPDEIIYSLTIKVIADGLLSDVLDFTSDSTPKASYDSSEEKRNVVLEFEGDVINGTSQETIHNTKIQLFPNPVSSHLNISYDTPESGHVQIKIYNPSSGTNSYLVNERKSAGQHQLQITDSTLLKTGINFITFTLNNESLTHKILILD